MEISAGSVHLAHLGCSEARTYHSGNLDCWGLVTAKINLNVPRSAQWSRMLGSELFALGLYSSNVWGSR